MAILVAYMEKQKLRLRKVKQGYWRRKKQEDARRMNAQFELDPGRVYSDFRRVIDDQGEVAKPKYVHRQEDNESCLLYTSPSPRDLSTSRMPSSA